MGVAWASGACLGGSVRAALEAIGPVAGVENKCHESSGRNPGPRVITMGGEDWTVR
jgi:hypothetical protein